MQVASALERRISFLTDIDVVISHVGKKRAGLSADIA